LALVPGSADVTDLLNQLCGRAVHSLPATGAGMSLLSGGDRCRPAAAADPVSERLEELQFVLGEGPCVDAVTSRRPVLVDRLGVDGPGRWPAYTSAAQEAGVRAVFAFPLRSGASRLGVLDFFRADEGHLSAPELGRAFALADDAVAILTGTPEADVVSTMDAEQLDELAGPAELFQAQGMVMVQIGGTLTQAMVRIRAYAYAENLRLIDVARAIVDRKLRFDPDR
jgi:hypothetical protein